MRPQFALCGLLLAVQAVGSYAEDLLRKVVDVEGIQRIVFNGAAELVVSQGDKESLVITASKSMQDRIHVAQKGSSLRLETREALWGFFDFDTRVRFEVTMSEIRAISAYGSGPVSVSDIQGSSITLKHLGSGAMSLGDIIVKELELKMAGSGDFSAQKMTAEEVELEAAGSGDIAIDTVIADELDIEMAGTTDLNLNRFSGDELEIELAGACNVEIADVGEVVEQDIVINGSGKYSAPGLQSRFADIEISGSTHVVVYVTEELQVEASGAADVRYYGAPRVEAHTSGASKVISLSKPRS
jgi:hypothetical protein